MKRLHLLVFRSFIGPFILIFFIVLFILLMQFLWRYIDDLVGKGLEFGVISELLLYTSSSLVPMALPLAILMSSLMTFGNMGEFYELTAIKASGISLQRIMMPLVILVIGISIGAFFFANEVLPFTNLKMRTLLYDVRNQRPEIQILPGSFYDGIDGYSLRIERKDPSTNMLYDIKIYDHTLDRGNINVIIADSGKMIITEDDRDLIFTLYSGYSYNELSEERDVRKKKNYPHRFDRFQEQRIIIELKGFSLNRTDESLFRNHYSMLDLAHLESMEDSINKDIDAKKRTMNQTLAAGNYFRKRNSPIRQADLNQSSLMTNRYDSILTATQGFPLSSGYPADSMQQRKLRRMKRDSVYSIQQREIVNLNKPTPDHHNKAKEVSPSRVPTKKTLKPGMHEPKKDSVPNPKSGHESVQKLISIADSNQSGAHGDIDKTKAVAKPAKKTNGDSGLYVNLFERLTLKEKENVLNGALSYARSARTYVVSSGQTIDAKIKNLRRFEVEWHRKFTIAFACFIFLFIGAPLGAIIRKGGLGLPLVISTLFFIFYYIISLMGEKIVRESLLPATQGMWIASFILFVAGIFLTYKATTDATILNFETYTNLARKYLGIRSSNIVEAIEKEKRNMPPRKVKYENLMASLSSFHDSIDDAVESVNTRLKFEGFLVSVAGFRESSNIILFERLYKNIIFSLMSSELWNDKSIQNKLLDFPVFNYRLYIDLRWRLYLRLALLLIPPGTILVMIAHYIRLIALKAKLKNINQLVGDLAVLLNKHETLSN